MIRSATADGVLTLTLARADKANALTEGMLNELTDAVLATNAQVIVFTGEGRVFSAGADLEAVARGLAASPAWEKLSGAIAGFPGLTIAALNGTVAGGALGMVLACDLRLAVDGAKFFYPVVKMGVLPQPSDPARLRALVGPARAKMILLTGAKLTTAEAFAFGMVDRVVTDQTALGPAIDALSEPAKTAKTGLLAQIKAMI
ncbi:MAG: enoyl-CoA hydratase [Thalassobium sp.]|uniref:enoyl-CoA hydratase/isomerase family protein n=1 Tax=Octadecabacter sp. SW4 TaxID=2602067 RepID=UPI000C0D1A61|nr:enoyl-CoA hydratase/isomerase family protein [Octadecabacter sp. SW4]PHQ86006.1 MAG: enoyl-CoA hydratase [Thalassobium sp.]QEE36969.1 enoyl-CoA hydratase/isomerase family protein [Octadecabacter sp. SW4]|tara:strand:- start:352 stop:957 length:606 start_codon:yes stop_codon:yes gene_type:complete